MAAGKMPCVEMNPYVALYGKQFALIELGRRLAKRPHMVRDRIHYLTIIEQALQTVSVDAQLLVIEGAGSPVELGLERCRSRQYTRRKNGRCQDLAAH